MHFTPVLASFTFYKTKTVGAALIFPFSAYLVDVSGAEEKDLILGVQRDGERRREGILQPLQAKQNQNADDSKPYTGRRPFPNDISGLRTLEAAIAVEEYPPRPPDHVTYDVEGGDVELHQQQSEEPQKGILGFLLHDDVVEHVLAQGEHDVGGHAQGEALPGGEVHRVDVHDLPDAPPASHHAGRHDEDGYEYVQGAEDALLLPDLLDGLVGGVGVGDVREQRRLGVDQQFQVILPLVYLRVRIHGVQLRVCTVLTVHLFLVAHIFLE